MRLGEPTFQALKVFVPIVTRMREEVSARPSYEWDHLQARYRRRVRLMLAARRYSRAALRAGVAGLLLLVSSGVARADEGETPICAPKAVMLKALLEKYHEAPTWAGVLHGGRPVVLTMADDGSWTLLAAKLVEGERVLCMTAAGEGSSLIEREAPSEEN